MDFGILKLKEDDIYSNNESKERAFLLIQGRVEFLGRGKMRQSTGKTIETSSLYAFMYQKTLK